MLIKYFLKFATCLLVLGLDSALSRTTLNLTQLLPGQRSTSLSSFLDNAQLDSALSRTTLNLTQLFNSALSWPPTLFPSLTLNVLSQLQLLCFFVIENDFRTMFKFPFSLSLPSEKQIMFCSKHVSSCVTRGQGPGVSRVGGQGRGISTLKEQ